MAFARSIKRIMNDVNELRKEPIDGVDIYQCEDNLKHIYVFSLVSSEIENDIYIQISNTLYHRSYGCYM